jgi:CRISPR-associated protein Cas2
MQGRGSWLQLSVFQARLSRRGLADLREAVTGIIKHDEDHVMILDLGPADDVKPRVSSLGKSFEPVSRQTIIV